MFGIGGLAGEAGWIAKILLVEYVILFVFSLIMRGKGPWSGIEESPLESLEGGRMIEGHDYTIYSNGPTGRSRMYAFLALITAFLTPLAQHGGLVLLRRYWRDDWDVTKAALFFGGFTALILFGVLINVFNGYLWRMSIGAWMFRLIGLSAPPNLNGEYCGCLLYTSDAADE